MKDELLDFIPPYWANQFIWMYNVCVVVSLAGFSDSSSFLPTSSEPAAFDMNAGMPVAFGQDDMSEFARLVFKL